MFAPSYFRRFNNQVSARQTFYDSAVDQYLADVGQFVILRAGFDTRALRLPKQRQVRSFEVDTPKTLAIKKEDWFDRLVEAGFDADKQPSSCGRA